MKRHAYLAALVIALFAGCGTGSERLTDFLDQFAATFGKLVRVPSSDSTAPVITLHVSDLGSGPVILTASSPPASTTLPASATAVLVAVAEDPEGVQQVGFSGEAQVRCSQGGIGMIRHELMGGPVSTDDDGDGQGLTRRWIPTYLSRSAYGCGTGWTFESASVFLRATGANFQGATGQSSAATFTWP